MSWRATWSRTAGAVRLGTAELPGLFHRGTLVAEVDLSLLGGNGDPLLDQRIGAQSLTLGLRRDGRLYGRAADGPAGVEAACGTGTETAHGTLRATWHWDSFNRRSLITAEHLDSGTLRQSETGGAQVVPRALVTALFTGRRGLRHPGVQWFALSDTIEPVGCPPGLHPQTEVETPEGPRPVASLRAGDRVLTADAGARTVLWSGPLRAPGLGGARPVRLLTPYDRRQKDIILHGQHRIAVSGSEVEYLFGVDEVLVEARHLVDGRTAIDAPSPGIVAWHGIVLERHHLLKVAGARVESQFLGDLGADPDLSALSAYRSLAQARGLPRHRAVRRQLAALEAAMLVQARARRCAPLAA
ncbi:MAG: Hint domain-containing protein [Pseudomonadota bacterium]